MDNLKLCSYYSQLSCYIAMCIIYTLCNIYSNAVVNEEQRELQVPVMRNEESSSSSSEESE